MKWLLGNTCAGSGARCPVKADVSQENGQVVFHGIKSSEKIAVYKTNGIRVPVRITRHGDSATLPLNSIPAGVCLLNVNGKTS